MNGIELLADTNFIINLNQGSSFTLPFLNYNFSVSYITEIELLGAFNISKKQKDIYKDILNQCVIFEMNNQIKQECIRIRNNHKLKIPDAIIAATSIVYNIPLITSDKEFEKVKELDLVFLKKE